MKASQLQKEKKRKKKEGITTSIKIVLQGPLAASVLQLLTKDDLSKLYFGRFRMLDINGVHCFLTRTGYVALAPYKFIT